MEISKSRLIVGLILIIMSVLILFITMTLWPMASDTFIITVTGATSLTALLGFILVAFSSVMGRIIVGLFFIISSLFLMYLGWDVREWWIFQIIAAIGLVLILSLTLTHLPYLRNLDLWSRGGFRGVVKNLRREGGLLIFWLEGAGEGGGSVQVEASLPDGVLSEGDTAWVKGELGGDGVIRTNTAHRLKGGAGTFGGSHGGATSVGQITDKRGGATLSGIVIGDVYELTGKNLIGGKASWSGIRLQLVDSTGNQVEVIECEIKKEKFVGIVFDRDKVTVKGEWTSSGRLKLKELRNNTTGAHVKFGWLT